MGLHIIYSNEKELCAIASSLSLSRAPAIGSHTLLDWVKQAEVSNNKKGGNGADKLL